MAPGRLASTHDTVLAPSTTGTCRPSRASRGCTRCSTRWMTAAVGEVSGHDVAEVERGIARMEALKLRLVARRTGRERPNAPG